MRTTLEQVKSLEDNNASGDIKVDEYDQLQELYIIKLKRVICILDINENKFPEGKKSHVGFKT